MGLAPLAKLTIIPAATAIRYGVPAPASPTDPTLGFPWESFLAELGVTGIIVAVLIWVYRDVTTSMREDMAALRKELAERTAKADEMNQTLMTTVAPAMAEMTRASRQVMELMVRRGDRTDSE